MNNKKIDSEKNELNNNKTKSFTNENDTLKSDNKNALKIYGTTIHKNHKLTQP